MTFRVHHLAISVADAARTARYYRAFGFLAVARFAKPELGATIVRLALGSCILEVFEVAGAALAPSLDEAASEQLRRTGPQHLGLSVDDLDGAIAALRAQGLDVPEARLAASGERHVFLRDPDGIFVELLER